MHFCSVAFSCSRLIHMHLGSLSFTIHTSSLFIIIHRHVSFTRVYHSDVYIPCIIQIGVAFSVIKFTRPFSRAEWYTRANDAFDECNLHLYELLNGIEFILNATYSNVLEWQRIHYTFTAVRIHASFNIIRLCVAFTTPVSFTPRCILGACEALMSRFIQKHAQWCAAFMLHSKVSVFTTHLH